MKARDALSKVRRFIVGPPTPEFFMHTPPLVAGGQMLRRVPGEEIAQKNHEAFSNGEASQLHTGEDSQLHS